MRRFVPAVLAFFGAACIAAAIAIPLYLVPQLKVVPLDLDITSDATTVAADGSTGERFPAVIFDRCSVSEDRARTLEAHLTQQRRSIIIEPSDSRQASLQSAQTVRIDRLRDAEGTETEPSFAAAGETRTCEDGLLTATIDRVSVNRKTSAPNGAVSSLQLEAVPEGGNVNDVSVAIDNRTGYQYKFGFDVQQRDYPYYDLNTRQDCAAKFEGEETIDGINTYHFVCDVPETDLSNLPNAQGEAALGTMLTMPARWWGITGRGVRANDPITMHRYAAATRHVWVEPETGTIVDGREDQHQYFKSPDQSDATPEAVREFRMDALKGTFKWTDDTVSNQASKASGYVDQLKVGGFWVPIILGIVGVILLIAAALLLFRGRRDDNRVDDTPAPTTPPADERDTTLINRDAPPAGAAPASANPWERPTEQIPKVGDTPPPDDSATRTFRKQPPPE
ncbi:DUF3068 domain-containing protein [Gordonia sp. JH63]|uniref:DUF3068 domain-containing protein n=1 Tax=Gordonia TaxID=2053 RepID=UPI00071CE656|nr:MULTISPECIES: DUF3068 domain-containing protein [Gordonia]KSU52543.1 hypothetical protein AS181_23110 [Gordonia sp. SGD-V-85]MBR7195047.1 DUF3068 domain-containing protein [Gordonia sp. SCSIO 19800]MCX2755248.1 DUF3068 domain-containing protein [Gordonia sp. 4N]MDT0221350.1 DUF3068 domain-containing protein [Gordonia sp. AC31]QHD87688.1 DUF3068 domain-containing protein [Gordonia sp. JH63]